MEKMILKLTKVKDNNEEEELLNEEMDSLAIIGDCHNENGKIMEVIAQASVKDIAMLIASSDKLIRAAQIAVILHKFRELDVEPVCDPEMKLFDQIMGGDSNEKNLQ